jgi:hypothetical protein
MRFVPWLKMKSLCSQQLGQGDHARFRFAVQGGGVNPKTQLTQIGIAFDISGKIEKFPRKPFAPADRMGPEIRSLMSSHAGSMQCSVAEIPRIGPSCHGVSSRDDGDDLFAAAKTHVVGCHRRLKPLQLVVFVHRQRAASCGPRECFRRNGCVQWNALQVRRGCLGYWRDVSAYRKIVWRQPAPTLDSRATVAAISSWVN